MMTDDYRTKYLEEEMKKIKTIDIHGLDEANNIDLFKLNPDDFNKYVLRLMKSNKKYVQDSFDSDSFIMVNPFDNIVIGGPSAVVLDRYLDINKKLEKNRYLKFGGVDVAYSQLKRFI
jgi:hypothetical protein